jgi:hypothetical protein
MENPEQSLEHLRFAAERLKSMYRISKQDVVNVLLVSQGLKPATEAQMLFKENTKSDPREEFERNIQELEQILSDLDLVYDEQHGHDEDTDMESVHFYIAQNEDTKNELVKLPICPSAMSGIARLQLYMVFRKRQSMRLPTSRERSPDVKTCLKRHGIVGSDASQALCLRKNTGKRN